MTLEEVIKQHILATMKKHRGNKAAVCRELNIARDSLYRMLYRWDKLENYRPRDPDNPPNWMTKKYSEKRKIK